jgi:hypothetical protein
LRERVVKVESAPGKSFDRGRFEIVEEAMPQDLDDSILGVDTKKVVAMRSNDTGAWTPEEIRERLSKS